MSSRALVPSLLLVLAAGAALEARAEEAPSTDARLAALEQQLAAMKAEIDRLRAEAAARAAPELEAKVEALTEEVERQRTTGGGVVPPLTDGVHGLGPAASKVYGVERGVSIGGYGEMVYENFDSDRDDGTASASKDRVDFYRAVLYTGYKFSDRFVFNSEIEYEHATTGAGDDEKGEVSVEQAYLDFLLHDHANLRAGLVLVPMGFINEVHEPTTFLGAKRPEVERQIIPSTWRENGVGLFGDAGPVSYRAYVLAGLDSAGFSAGSGLRGGRQSGSRSLAEDLAFVARVDVEPVDGLTIGASAYTGSSGQDAKTPGGQDVGARVTLWEAHLEAAFKGLDFRFLWAEGDIDDADLVNEANGLTGNRSVGSSQEGWYAQVGYDVLAHLDTNQELIPFVRYEEYDTQADVPDGYSRNPANERATWTYGFSYKPHPQVVLKLDWQDVDNEADTATDQFNLGVGYTF